MPTNFNHGDYKALKVELQYSARDDKVIDYIIYDKHRR
jgi:hypothetical protein